ncbi:hypothetical protein QBC37DRAFT_76724 [Rhypophila decipiens]|uniref:Uncharacterized protein n=1 Tax=Rhypophila decipiens TaxID=261697 RepID=A0AAN6YK80_9PEZI|nr:hypothetical protein QBC37DRAFT_76724 [Rhypophila decipiens]
MAPSLVSFTPVNTRHEENHPGFSVSTASVPAKRQLEPSQDWSKFKRQKQIQDIQGSYGESRSSTLQPVEASKRVEGPPFPGLGSWSHADDVPLTTHTDSNHDAVYYLAPPNDFYHPTPPSTDSTLVSCSQPGHSSILGAGEYQRSDGTLSAVPFPDCLHPVQSYPEHEDVTNYRAAQTDLQLQHDQVEPTRASRSDEPSIEDPNLDHISAMHRFLSFKASERAAKQSAAVQPKSSDNMIDSSGNETDYFCEDSLEEEMAQLVEPRIEVSRQFPPSSVVRDMDAGSDTEIFDLRLQRSPPSESKGPGEVKDLETFEGEDLLSSDVDWDDIFKSVPSHSDPVSQPLPVSNTTPAAGTNRLIGDPRTGSSGKDVAISKIRSTPSTQRPQTSAAYSSPSTPSSASHKMRTCFRMVEVINEGRRRLHEQPPPTFEFFGWVIQSWREQDVKVQHFYFLDLYKKDNMFLRGTLSGWVTNGDLDKQSSAFLSADSKPMGMLCRCVCKVQQDQGGLYLVLRFIRPASWAEIGVKKDSAM